MNHTFRNFKHKFLNIEKAEGIYIYSNRKKILDMTAGISSFQILGWNNNFVNNAIKTQMKLFSHICYKTFNDKNIDKLSNILIKNADHKLDAVYYSGNSGGEACEAAMKLSFLTHQAYGQKKKKWFIGRDQSYHGINTDAISIAERPGLEIYKSFFSKFRDRVSQNHYLYERYAGESEEDYSKRCAIELEKKILKLGPENVSGFVGETMMGGLIGDVEPSKNYWKYIRKVCDKYNVHLILDECYCGLGTNGKLYCCDWDKITPDFIFVAKALSAGYVPMSAVVTRKKYEQKILDKFGRVLHSTTNQGHSLGIAASLACQKIITKKKTLNNVNYIGNYMRKVIKDELGDHEFFFDVRGRGLRFSFEYRCKNKNQFGLKLKEIMLKKHHILISGKWHRVCFTPALIINKEQSELVLDKFIKEFKKLSKSWR